MLQNSLYSFNLLHYFWNGSSYNYHSENSAYDLPNIDNETEFSRWIRLYAIAHGKAILHKQLKDTGDD